MSDSSGLPASFSFEARDVILNMTIMETFGDGIYSAVFWFTLYMIVFRKRAKGAPLGLSGILIIVPLYILAMIHLSIRWVVCRRAFVVDGDTAADVLNSFLGQPQWCNVLSVISFTLMLLIADFVTVWRLWVVWNRNWKVALFPFLVNLIGIAFAIMSAVFQIDPSSGLDTDKFNKFANYSLVYFSLSLASTVICTCLIVYRILNIARETSIKAESPYRKILEIIVESAALYSVALLIFLPFLTRDDFSDGYPQAVLICITGIAPTLITGRVSLGFSRDYTTVRPTQDSSIFIAPNATGATTASRTVNNESTNELGSLGSEKKEERADYRFEV